MKLLNRSKIVVPVVSLLTVVALSAQAQDAVPSARIGEPPAGNPRAQPQPPAAAARPAYQRPSGAGAQGGPAAARIPQGGNPRVAHGGGPMPSRVYGGHPYRGHLAWEGGQWRHETYNGRAGWWWDVGGVRYYYPQRVEGPPVYISEDYVDDDVVYAAPAAAYAPPPPAYAPPPPPPAPDPGASALGGAIVGGVLGGLLTGRAVGAAAGAVVGGATGAIAGATATSRPGYWVAEGNCYYRYPDGRYVAADPRWCY